MMLTEEILVQKFTTVAKERCPEISDLLQYCHIELVSFYWGVNPKLCQYFVVYFPHQLFTSIIEYRDIFRDIAQDLGTSEAICMNATRIIRDPGSNLKQTNPVLWLELQWVAAQHLEM